MFFDMVRAATAPKAKRLSAMRRIALWEGKLSRGRIIELHDLSGVRASQCLREFRDTYPTWLAIDTKSKSYVATEQLYDDADCEMKSHPSADLGLLSLSAYLPQTRDATDDGHSTNGGIAVSPWELSQIGPNVFPRMRMAIEQHTQLQLSYRPLGTLETHRRTIEPHSLVRGGRIWHVRAHCNDTGQFTNFVPGGISKVRLTGKRAASSAENDAGWSELVKVRFVPHPGLSSEQQDIVRHDCLLGTKARVQRCRGAMVPYLVDELRLAVDVTRQIPPDYRLAVHEPKSIEPWLQQT